MDDNTIPREKREYADEEEQGTFCSNCGPKPYIHTVNAGHETDADYGYVFVVECIECGYVSCSTIIPRETTKFDSREAFLEWGEEHEQVDTELIINQLEESDRRPAN